MQLINEVMLLYIGHQFRSAMAGFDGHQAGQAIQFREIGQGLQEVVIDTGGVLAKCLAADNHVVRA